LRYTSINTIRGITRKTICERQDTAALRELILNRNIRGVQAFRYAVHPILVADGSETQREIFIERPGYYLDDLIHAFDIADGDAA
jgi:hypothetical protein